MADDIVERPVHLPTSDGLTIHGELAVPSPINAAAIICHPHPQMGGDRRNPLVNSLFRALPAAGVAALRFDFRGVGRSEGTFGGGIDERHDAVGALELVAGEVPDVPLWGVGYSFGADVALSVDHPRLAGWVAVAPPLRVLASPAPAAAAGRATTLVVPAHDQFCPPERAQAETSDWSDTTIVEVSMGDHFLAGRMQVVSDLVIEALTPA